VLDEPTNDLDSETLELLEQRLVEYEGTVLLVSHDRAFLNNVVTSTLVFEGESLQEYVGGYDDWVRQRTARQPAELLAAPKRGRDESSAKPLPVAAEPFNKPKRLSYKTQRELEQLPVLIEELEAKQQAIHATMLDPAFFKQPKAVIASKQAESQDVAAQLAAAYERWAELE